MLIVSNMGISNLIHVLWVAALALQILLAGVLLSKKMWIRFPLFTAYCATSALGGLIAYWLAQKHAAYVYAYIANQTMLVILALGVIYEVFTQLFAGHRGLRKLALLTFRAVGVLLLLLGAIVLYTHSPIGEKGLVAAVLVVEEASRVVEVGLIMLLFLFSSAFGLQWRQQVFGIVLGLGISAAVRLAATTIAPHSFATVGAVNLLVMSSYVFTLLIWLGYTVVPERISAVELPERVQLEQWNQAIMELINQ